MHPTSLTSHPQPSITADPPGYPAHVGIRSRRETALGTLATDVPMCTHAIHPADAPGLSQPLRAAPSASSEEKSPKHIPTLRTDQEFNADIRRATHIYQDALHSYEESAHQAFVRDRSLLGRRVVETYATFKSDRSAALNAPPDSPADVTQMSAYQRLSENRWLAGLSADDPLHGKSPLETYLPKNSAFRRLLEPQLRSIRDVRTGLNAQLVRRDGKPPGSPDRYILTFPGTGVANTAGAQWKTNIRQFLGIGGVPTLYRQALTLAEELGKNLPARCELELCGHSLGGGIASYVGLSLGLKAVGFNAAPLGPGCLKALLKANALTPENLTKLTQIRTEGDPVTSRTVSTLLTRLAYGEKLFGSRIPQLPGTVYKISRHRPNDTAHPTASPQKPLNANPFDTPGSLAQRHTMQGFINAYKADRQ